ncbi:MAG: dioxygenase [Betaproteobacteria bacterium]|nr:dioxygenase [Betaproteobacteria bacterium]
MNLPSLFLPHGAPTFALRPGAAGLAMSRIAARLPRPRAVVIVSPHWETRTPTIGTGERLETIHDFYGFPAELYDIQYPATGCPEAAAEVVDTLRNSGLAVDESRARGLDHGAWVPLRQMYPDADVPVIPLSLQSHLGVTGAYRLGQALAPLRTQGFLIIGSGNITHNLGDYHIASAQPGASFDYLRAFPQWMTEQLQQQNITSLLDYRQRAPQAARAHPTDEHLQPLYVALGAAGERPAVEHLHTGISDYVLAMDAYAFTSQH